MFGKDKQMFAYDPPDGYRDERDAVEVPWTRWEQEIGTLGKRPER